MPQTVSTIPACLDALVALARAALPDARVSDGQPFELALDMICIAFTGVRLEPSVYSTLTQEQMATDPSRESYDVVSLASSLRGDVTETGDVPAKPVRDRVFELVGAIAARLALDPTLGEVVMRARLSVVDFVQMQTDEGAAATLRFTVHVDAYTR